MRKSRTPVRTLPVAKFNYKGSHSKPVRRTVILTEVTSTFVRGIEVREGNEIRSESKAPIKSFTLDKTYKFDRTPMRSSQPW